MSYILDALKKAESERKLGSVPNVYMESVPIAKSDEPRSPHVRAWIAIAAALACVGIAVAWWIVSQSEAQHAPDSASSTVVAQAAPASQDLAPKAVDGFDAVPPSKPAPKTDVAGTHSPDMRAVQPAPAAKAPSQAAGEKAVKATSRETDAAPARRSEKPVAQAEAAKSVKTQAKPADEPSQVPQKAAEKAAEKAADIQVAALRELPEHIQRTIPPVSIGGYIYSPNPAERSMLLNNRLVREGEQTATGLILEKMMPKEAIMSYQGQRFRLAY